MGTDKPLENPICDGSEWPQAAADIAINPAPDAAPDVAPDMVEARRFCSGCGREWAASAMECQFCNLASQGLIEITSQTRSQHRDIVSCIVLYICLLGVSMIGFIAAKLGA